VKKIILAAVFTSYHGSAWCQTPASVVVPPITESTIVFTDRGRTYFAGTSTGKVIAIDQSSTPTPPVPSASNIPKIVKDSILAIATLDAASRKQGAEAMAAAIDTTLSEAGGLNITDPQAIVVKLAENAELSKASTILKGWKLGDILSGQKITNKEQLVAALAEVKKGLVESAK